jgi:glycine/D-amino acid oxidase-like deaminating enzyme
VQPDVVVIGGGIVGVAAAAQLALSGRSTLLLERATVGAAASGRNSGVVQHPFDPVLADLYRRTVEAYRALPGFTFASEPAGMLMATIDPVGARRLTDELAVAWPSMAPEFVGPEAMRDVEPALAPDLAACRLRIGYPVGPIAATRAYAAAARAAGATIEEGAAARPWIEASRVLGVERLGADGRVAGRVAAGTVVVAAGPWSPALIDPTGAWQPISPLWGVVVDVVLAAPPRHVIEEAWIDIEPSEPGKTGGHGQDHAFSLVTADGRSSVGSTFLTDAPDSDAWVPALLDRATRFVPAIATAAVGASRACARPLSRDGRPLIGSIPGLDGLLIAAGHGPWGISTGPGSAVYLIAAMDGQPVPTALDPARFGSIG